MILLITEINAWERERWSYILDAEKQGAYVINQLFLFKELANIHFKKAHEEMRAFPFAASKYVVQLFDSYEINERGTVILVHADSRLHISRGGDYKKSGELTLDTCISPRRMHSAVVNMRDKQENIIYKDFEALFLAK